MDNESYILRGEMLKDIWTPPYEIVNTRGVPKLMHEFIRIPILMTVITKLNLFY